MNHGVVQFLKLRTPLCSAHMPIWLQDNIVDAIVVVNVDAMLGVAHHATVARDHHDAQILGHPGRLVLPLKNFALPVTADTNGLLVFFMCAE